MMGSQPILTAWGVSRSFQSGTSRCKVIDGICLELEAGALTVLQGRSGSGKTTLLNLLGALDRPDSGKIYFEGREITSMTDKARNELRRTRMGFIFQSVALISTMNVYENVEFQLLISGYDRSFIHSRVQECLRAVGLENRLSHRTQELSGGEQQRVAVARAIASHPRILFADEPTAELDVTNGIKIVSLLHRLAADEGIGVIMTTHDSEMAKIADRIYTIRDGVLAK